MPLVFNLLFSLIEKNVQRNHEKFHRLKMSVCQNIASYTKELNDE